MLHTSILCAIAGAATIAAGGAMAAPGGGGGHSMGAMHANAHALAAPHMAAPQSTLHGRVNSQGPVHASPTGVLHANSHSVLKGTTVVGGSIAGLTKGMIVKDASGNTVGTVKAINTASGGRVVNVLVKSSTGARTIPLSPSTMSVSGGVAMTTSLKRHQKA